MVWLWPALLTTSMPLPEIVNVWGEVEETFEIVKLSPVCTVGTFGVK